MSRRLIAEGTDDERIELTCDACGRSDVEPSQTEDLSLERPPSGDAAAAELPDRWRADSRYDYCPQCGPTRIRTMAELEAEARA